MTAPGISDGFYKALTIFTALESEPSLLVVDEVENSLHAKALELLIDELKMSECRTILTTHSPIVVDIVEPKDLILVDKGDEGSVFRRSEKPEEVRKALSERGIILDYELEEWICYSFGIQLGVDKPFKALSDRCKEKRGSKEGYKKWQLPRFVENLDINALRRNCHSFEDFVSILLSGK